MMSFQFRNRQANIKKEVYLLENFQSEIKWIVFFIIVKKFKFREGNCV